MMLVTVYENKIDVALAKLRNMMKKENLLGDIKKHEHYRKPSIKKREKREAATAKRIAASRAARKQSARAKRDS